MTISGWTFRDSQGETDVWLYTTGDLDYALVSAVQRRGQILLLLNDDSYIYGQADELEYPGEPGAGGVFRGGQGLPL